MSCQTAVKFWRVFLATCLQQQPLAVVIDRVTQLGQQGAVEVFQTGYCRLLWSPPQLHRQLHLPALWLALVDQTQARQCQSNHSRRLAAFDAQRLGGAALVVVLDETRQMLLIRHIRGQVPSHLQGVAFFQPVVEPLVIRVVKSLLLQVPLEIPVDLGQRDKAGMPCPQVGDRRWPELGARRIEGAAPRPQERVLRHQHRHVAAHAVAALGDVEQDISHRAARHGRAVIDLHRVGPAAE